MVSAGVIYYRGKGLFVLWIFAAGALGFPGLWRMFHGETMQHAFQTSGRADVSVAAGIILSGFVLIPLGIYLNRNPNRPVLDRETGRTVRAGAQHTMYSLRMEIWGGIILAGGLYMLYRMLPAHAA